MTLIPFFSAAAPAAVFGAAAARAFPKQFTELVGNGACFQASDQAPKLARDMQPLVITGRLRFIGPNNWPNAVVKTVTG